MYIQFRSSWSTVLLAAVAVAALCAAPARAQDGASAPAPASASADAAHHASKSIVRPYAIEFRARSAQSYGHTFSMHGRINAQGKFIKPTVSGLHPATESPVPWMVGHLVAVPSETGPSDGDFEDQYVIARFRIALTEPEYRKVAAYIRTLSKKSPLWHAVVYNCNAFVGDIARFMGYKTPTSTMLMPQEYIDSLRDMNINRADLAGAIGTPVKVEGAAALREAALKAIERKKQQSAHAAPKPRTTAAVTPHPAGAAAAPADSKSRSAKQL